MYAALIAAASGEAPGAAAGFDANGSKLPSSTALTASNIASCAMVVRTCVRSAFSPTAIPREVMRVPQSLSTAAPDITSLVEFFPVLLTGLLEGVGPVHAPIPIGVCATARSAATRQGANFTLSFPLIIFTFLENEI